MRKGASWGIALIITLIIIIIFAGVFMLLFEGFLHAVAPPGEAEKNSFEELYQAITLARDAKDNKCPVGSTECEQCHDVLSVTGFGCMATGESFYLSKNYYIQADAANPAKIELLKTTKSKEESVTSGSFTDFKNNYLCCEKDLDFGDAGFGENCNTDCNKGERFVLGKDKTVDGMMCVCINKAGNIKVWKANTDYTCYWRMPTLW